jgi:FkbM family methyltransferase
MATFYLAIYRIYFAVLARHAQNPGVVPRSLKKAAHDAHVLIKRFILPRFPLTVRVRSGLSLGLWLRVRFPEEAGYWRGTHESSTARAIVANVREGSVVYDVGAHIGLITFGAARLAGNSGRVIAFEPDPDNVVRLREGCALNHLERRVRVVNSAVWSHGGSEEIGFRRGASRRSRGGVEADGYQPVLADGPTVKVPVMTLDEFADSSGTAPGLIKIDVEGGEYEVLRGGETLFARCRPLLLVEVHHRDAFERIDKWLSDFKYAAQWGGSPQGFPKMLFAWPAESLPNF